MTYKKYLSGLGLACLLLFSIAPATAAVAPVDHLTASPASATVQSGESITWMVTAYRTDGTTSDVSDVAIFAIPEKAGGMLSGATYTTQYVGKWEIPVSIGSLSTITYLNVVHDSPVALTINPDTVTKTADETVVFSTKLTDAQGNTWDATDQTAFSTTEKNASFNNNVYTLSKIGVFVVTAQIAGFATEVPITVTSGAPASINLTPSQPFMLSVGAIQNIGTKLYDKEGNEITSAQAGLTLIGDAAALTSDGNLQGMKPGTVTLHAGYGDLDVQTEITVVKATNENTASDTEGRVLGESVNSDTNEETTTDTQNESLITPIEEENQSTETSDTQECSTIELWIALVILAVFGIILLGYYTLIKRDEDKSWWIFPVLLTAIGIIIWTKYFCDGAYPWWPWILVLLGAVVTWYGRGPMRKDSAGDIPPGNTPPDEGQKPLF